jgi:dUTP pyrophosphatase
MKIKVLNNGVELPIKASELAAGVDLKVTSFKRLFKGNVEIDINKLATSIKNGYLTLRGHERVLCGTNLFVELPENLHIEIRDRSGISLKRGLLMANSPGTIDADYRGEIGLIIYNSTPYLNKIELGERLGQAVLMQHIPIEWEKVDELQGPDRNGGYGSTGTK